MVRPLAGLLDRHHFYCRWRSSDASSRLRFGSADLAIAFRCKYREMRIASSTGWFTASRRPPCSARCGCCSAEVIRLTASHILLQFYGLWNMYSNIVSVTTTCSSSVRVAPHRGHSNIACSILSRAFRRAGISCTTLLSYFLQSNSSFHPPSLSRFEIALERVSWDVHHLFDSNYREPLHPFDISGQFAIRFEYSATLLLLSQSSCTAQYIVTIFCFAFE